MPTTHYLIQRYSVVTRYLLSVLHCLWLPVVAGATGVRRWAGGTFREWRTVKAVSDWDKVTCAACDLKASPLRGK